MGAAQVVFILGASVAFAERKLFRDYITDVEQRLLSSSTSPPVDATSGLAFPYSPQQHSPVQPHIPKRRVLITGLGVVSGVGIGVEDFWKNLKDGYNPCDVLPQMPTGYSCRIGCPVDDTKFNAADWYRSKGDANKNDRYAHFAMAAAKMALKDAQIDLSRIQPEKFGVLISSGIGGIAYTQRQLETFLNNGAKSVSPYLVPAMIANTSPGSVAIEVGALGPNFGIVSACASGSHSIGEALRIVQRGEADMMLAGGSEATLTDFVLNGFNRLRATATGWNADPKRASRPFDAKRSGFVMGEGSGVLLLESEEHALKRGAKIYGELAGYSATCDSHHITAPHPQGRGLISALKNAIAEAGVELEDIGYINAHGTSTPLNDQTETAAIRQVFGSHAEKLLISSSKGQTGHCLGAAGGIEAVATAKALHDGVAPPTINLDHPDPKCGLFYCPHKAVKKEEGFKAVVSNSLGFGGQNAVLVMKKYPS